MPTYTNNTGSTVTVVCQVRIQGWAYVWAGTARTGATTNVKVGDTLVTNTTNAFAISGTSAIGSTVGFALATAINTTQFAPGGPLAAGVVSVVPTSLVGITANTIVLIDSLGSGVQEAVSVGSISYPTFSIAVTNAHSAGFRSRVQQPTRPTARCSFRFRARAYPRPASLPHT